MSSSLHSRVYTLAIQKLYDYTYGLGHDPVKLYALLDKSQLKSYCSCHNLCSMVSS
jgi:hypothetical protein